MTKEPRVGYVKSRLGAQIGEEVAAELYRCFLLDMVETLDMLEVDCLIYYTPDDAEQSLIGLFGEDRLYMPQVGCDLGMRLYHGLKAAGELGYDAAFAVASDIPDITVQYLGEAVDALADHDVVIGPSVDGGYHLIGLKLGLNDPSFFTGITWGTESVYVETMQRLQGHDVYVLPEWSDMDDASSLRNHKLQRGSHTYRCLMDHKLL